MCPGGASWEDVAWGCVLGWCPGAGILGGRGLGARVLGGILGGRGRLPGPGALCRVISTHGQGPDVEAEEETPGVGVQKVWETTETSELERPRTGL